MKPTPEAIEVLTDAGYQVNNEGRHWYVTKGGKLVHSTPYASAEWINNFAREVAENN